MLDARERAPLKGHRDMYVGADGKVDHDLSMAHAIKHAEDGFEVDRVYHRLAKFRLEVLQRYESTRQIFLRDGEIPELGSLIKQPDLAQTLRLMASNGRDGFYHGEIADKLVSSVKANGGVWSHQDLNQYQLIEREPVRFTYGDAKFTAATLPSSGGIVLASIFNMLDELGYAQASEDQQIHMVVEAMRRAYRDRAEYLGDIDYVDIPDELTSQQYAKKLLENFSSQHATPSSTLGKIADDAAGNDTTHFSIIDAEGNMVSATLSVNYPFGSGLIADGTGV